MKGDMRIILRLLLPASEAISVTRLKAMDDSCLGGWLEEAVSGEAMKRQTLLFPSLHVGAGAGSNCWGL